MLKEKSENMYASLFSGLVDSYLYMEYIWEGDRYLQSLFWGQRLVIPSV